MIPLKYKTWILKKKLEHGITYPPSAITGNEESVKFLKIDKNQIILDKTNYRFGALVYLLIFLLAAKMFYDLASGDMIFIIIGLFISSVFVLLSLITICWLVFFRRKQVIFDRIKGTVSIPGPFWYKNLEVPFKDVVAIIRTETYYYAHLKVLNLYRPDGYKANVGINSYSLDALRNDWAFYVWYMDKSRPLPPAPVFDTYRDSLNHEPLLGEVL